MQAHRPWRPCSSPAVATRVQTERARPTAFTRPTPTGAPGSPLPTHSPTPFCAPHRATLFHHERRRTARYPFLLSPLLYYIYARVKGTFPPLGGRGSVRPAVEKRKGGEKRTGRWTFSPHRGKDCGKQIVDKWKIGALFPPPRDERIQSGEQRPSSGALNRESAARSPQSLTRGGESKH